MDTLRRHRWRVKDTICSPWQELPGLYTAFEIWGMRRRGYFSAATPIEETESTARQEELQGVLPVLGILTYTAGLNGLCSVNSSR